MSRKLNISALTMLVLVLGAWAFFVQRPVYHARPGFVRVMCPGTVDAQVPYHEGMTLLDLLKSTPAISQFGIDQVDTIWLMTNPTHSAWSDVSEAMKEVLIKRTPALWLHVAAYWPDPGTPSFPLPMALTDRLTQGEAVHLQARW